MADISRIGRARGSVLALTRIPFQGGNIEALRDDRGVWISIRRCCETLGLDLRSQLRRLRRSPWATMVTMTTVAADGKRRSILMLHLDALPMWLATIEASRVSPPVRPRLVAYQCEAAAVLKAHFFGAPAPALAPSRPLPRRVLDELVDEALRQSARAAWSDPLVIAHVLGFELLPCPPGTWPEHESTATRLRFGAEGLPASHARRVRVALAKGLLVRAGTVHTPGDVEALADAFERRAGPALTRAEVRRIAATAASRAVARLAR